jgi:hypothetical protein
VPSRVKRNKAGLATQSQLEALGRRYARALQDRGFTFDQLVALSARADFRDVLTESTLHAVEGAEYIEKEVFVPNDASFQDILDLEQWEFLGHKRVLATLVSQAQVRSGKMVVVLIKPPTSLMKRQVAAPGWSLDTTQVVALYKSMRLRPDLLAQAALNRDQNVARERPNICYWPSRKQHYSITFDARGKKKYLVASYAGDRIAGDLWLVGVPL